MNSSLQSLQGKEGYVSKPSRCERCGYSSHLIEKCYAKKDIKGNVIDDLLKKKQQLHWQSTKQYSLSPERNIGKYQTIHSNMQIDDSMADLQNMDTETNSIELSYGDLEHYAKEPSLRKMVKKAPEVEGTSVVSTLPKLGLKEETQINSKVAKDHSAETRPPSSNITPQLINFVQKAADNVAVKLFLDDVQTGIGPTRNAIDKTKSSVDGNKGGFQALKQIFISKNFCSTGMKEEAKLSQPSNSRGTNYLFQVQSNLSDHENFDLETCENSRSMTSNDNPIHQEHHRNMIFSQENSMFSRRSTSQSESISSEDESKATYASTLLSKQTLDIVNSVRLKRMTEKIITISYLNEEERETTENLTQTNEVSIVNQVIDIVDRITAKKPNNNHNITSIIFASSKEVTTVQQNWFDSLFSHQFKSKVSGQDFNPAQEGFPEFQRFMDAINKIYNFSIETSFAPNKKIQDQNPFPQVQSNNKGGPIAKIKSDLERKKIQQNEIKKKRNADEGDQGEGLFVGSSLLTVLWFGHTEPIVLHNLLSRMRALAERKLPIFIVSRHNLCQFCAKLLLTVLAELKNGDVMVPPIFIVSISHLDRARNQENNPWQQITKFLLWKFKEEEKKILRLEDKNLLIVNFASSS